MHHHDIPRCFCYDLLRSDLSLDMSSGSSLEVFSLRAVRISGLPLTSCVCLTMHDVMVTALGEAPKLITSHMRFDFSLP
jgi:hypothetical protein